MQGSQETKFVIKRDYAQFSRSNLTSIQSEIVEKLNRNDPRFEKLFYHPKGIKKAGGKVPDEKIEEP